MVEDATNMGLAACLNQLFTLSPLPDPPVKYVPDGSGRNAINDPAATYGTTWVNGDPFPNVNPPMLRNRVIRGRSKSLYAWTFLQMHKNDISLLDKMVVFWHNHFVVGQSIIPHREYLYQRLLRTHALGNFKQLTKDMTIDTSMLIYLSGTENTNRAPNENYSRELLELFTVGKGPLAGPGDYTNYTEDDVVEMAKVLTGWRVLAVSDPNTLTAQFVASRHTTGRKILSHRFNNTIILDNGADEYKDLIDVIFQQDACSRFIMRKLYRWFVHSEITADVETNIIEPLATMIRNNNYEIAPALRVLFASDHFFETTACMIKSPVDLMLSVTRGLNVVPPNRDVMTEYEYGFTLYITCYDLEQALYQHPDVAGWKAWYQAPQYDKIWINNLLLPKRHTFCEGMVQGATLSIEGANYPVGAWVPVLEIAASVPQASDPNTLVETLAERMFAYRITSNQKDSLKGFLTAGLPDYEWTIEYNDYLQNPNDVNMRLAIENKLRNLIGTMVQMSEFQIM